MISKRSIIHSNEIMNSLNGVVLRDIQLMW